MKGSPARLGTIQGTSGHASALKQKEEENLFEKQEKLKEKEAKREAKRESGKKVFLGKMKTKRNLKKQEKTQENIDKQSFGKSFGDAGDAGLDTFTWRDKKYTTETRSEKKKRQKDNLLERGIPSDRFEREMKGIINTKKYDKKFKKNKKEERSFQKLREKYVPNVDDVFDKATDFIPGPIGKLSKKLLKIKK